MENFFSNEVTTTASVARVQEILLDLPQLLSWDPDIASVDTLAPDHYRLVRRGPAFNDSEELIVQTPQPQEVRYQSRGGRIDYDVHFTLTRQDERTVITEQVDLLSATSKGLPLRLLRPLAQPAFQTNLNRLAHWAEQSPANLDAR